MEMFILISVKNSVSLGHIFRTGTVGSGVY